MRALSLVLAVLLLLSGGCAARRGILPDAESRQAVSLFTAAFAAAPFPASASFSGVADTAVGDYPFIAGLKAPTPSEETVGVYDPLGRVVMMLSNDGSDVSVEAGPAAEGSILNMAHGKAMRMGPVSFGRILSGSPAYPILGGRAESAEDGGWILSDGRQTLRTDPDRRFVARGEYTLAGRSVVVTYPGRKGAVPPRVVGVEMIGAKIELRRDEE